MARDSERAPGSRANPAFYAQAKISRALFQFPQWSFPILLITHIKDRAERPPK